MKKLTIIAFLMWAGLNVNIQAQNPLAGTAWEGTAELLRPRGVTLQFDKDTIRMYSVPDDIQPELRLLETSTYTTKNDTFSWKKVKGRSPCDTETLGTWRYTIKNEEITFIVVDDACSVRSAMLPHSFKKVAYEEGLSR